jgi:CheY-like chemotaxis protein
VSHPILVVEDDVNGQNIIKSLLEARGFTVDSTSNAEQALQMLYDTHYEAAIIDLSLPGLSGWELLSAIAENFPELQLPCIAMTAYHSNKVAQQTRDAGFVAYFAKPFDIEGFADHISELLSPS